MDFIKIPLTEEMREEYKKCADMMDNGEEKNCLTCILYGGDAYGCMGEYPWRREIAKGNETYWSVTED